MPKTWSSQLQLCKPVFFTASFLILALVLVGSFATEWTAEFFQSLQGSITKNFSWFYVLSMTAFLVFVVYLFFSPFGHIRLGKDSDRPEFGYLTWLSMLFSAGMGIGLLFYGVAEPVMHFESPIQGRAGGMGAAREAMALSFLHWGFHPWACYCLIALILAYFGFRKGLPFSLRSAFHPFLKDRIYGFWGHVVDTLAVVSTLFGVATSLGLGAMQINAGLEYKFGLEASTGMQVTIIAIITAIATISVVTGIKAGIRRLSEANMFIAAGLLIFVFLMGPTLTLLNSFVENIGSYLQLLPQNAFWTEAYTTGKDSWIGSWTVFYWAWWIAWSPFVGLFIARISKGRTVREFLGGVLFVPCLIAFIWLTVFGNSAISSILAGNEGLAQAVATDVPSSLFVFLESFPFPAILAFFATLCITLFFVTSSDSASLVIDTIASGGQHNPPVIQKVYWAILEGIVAAILLLVGGLSALQTASITTALPFTFVIILMAFAFLKAIRNDKSVH